MKTRDTHPALMTAEETARLRAGIDANAKRNAESPEPAEHPDRQLTNDELLPIRQAVLSDGRKLADVAAEYQVSSETIVAACSSATAFRGRWPAEIGGCASPAVVRARHA